jgi:hypothetical protein
VDGVCDCGRLIQQPEVGRRRQKCFICSPRDMRDRRVSSPRNSVIVLPPRDSDEPTLFSLTRRALDKAGVLESWPAAAALKLAEHIDAGGRDAARLVVAHRDAMAFALQDAGDDADIITAIFNSAD